jgi:hypothetical protein
MDSSATALKPAPTKIVRFLGEILGAEPGRGTVISVEVESNTYRVTLAVPDRGLVVVPLSAFDVSRSVRGDREALAALGADLVRGTRGGD